ncbi:hypothetical protein EC30301_5261 [Escherichia coli 3030-1]|nr:hypothetical protein EC30301_5261 [Escherichia coli 3030-1]
MMGNSFLFLDVGCSETDGKEAVTPEKPETVSDDEVTSDSSSCLL